MKTNKLEQPLSKWKRLRARCLGAYQPPRSCSHLAMEKSVAKTAKQYCIKGLKYIVWFVFCAPFLPTIGAIVCYYTFGYNAFGYKMCLNILVADAIALTFLGVCAKRSVNVFGLTAFFIFATACCLDRFCQILCLKVLNKNFKKYPFKQMMQNAEINIRRENALCLCDENAMLELYFCLHHCNNQTMKDVLKWCNGSSEQLQYRHLEELRGRTLEHFSSYASYTQVFSKWVETTWGGKPVYKIANNRMFQFHQKIDKLLAVYAQRNRLEEVSEQALENLSHTEKKPRRI